ncbi:MAG: CapA family protein, partial [Candidatus Paceibacteria bacterium]
MIKLAITGDVMLGRLVDEYILQDQTIPSTYVWGDILPLLHNADLRFINLECVISEKGQPWTKTPKVFHFRARPRAIESLQSAKIDYASLANNHILDFGKEALFECLELLSQAGIKFSGAGRNINEALTPAFIESKGIKFAVISLTDNEPAWEAKGDLPGVNFIAYDGYGLKEPYLSRIRQVMQKSKKETDFVIMSAHVGPNWGKPSPDIIALAHQFIDLGADLYWGHSNHTVQGIEIYQGKPILYSTGDFIDDYAVVEIERNDECCIFIYAEEYLELYPIIIKDFKANLAKNDDKERIMK